MEFKYKLIAVAVLALLSGTAFAAPMLVVPLDVKAYPHVPEGPKADFSVEMVYANFKTVSWEQSRTETRMALNYTSGEASPVNVTIVTQFTNVSYLAVANITNLSDLDAKMYEASFAAAQKISIIQTALGGESFDQGYIRDPGTNFGGVITGVWLDGKYVDTTWVPGKDYPLNLYQVITPQHKIQSGVPELPENASEEGTWIEGVPIAEYYDHTHMTATHMYINGAWVDVTGRVQACSPQPMVLASNCLVDEVLTSGIPIYRNQGNASVGPVTAIPDWKSYNSNGPSLNWTGGYGFDKTWLPHQSKLIAFSGTLMVSGDSGINSTLTSMDNGTIDLYGSMTNFITNMPVNGTYTNTVSTATWFQTVPLQKTADGYTYNAILSPTQVFQFTPNQVEVYIKEGNTP